MIPSEIQAIYEEAGITPRAIAYSIVVKKPKNTITPRAIAYSIVVKKPNTITPRTNNAQLNLNPLNSRD